MAKEKLVELADENDLDIGECTLHYNSPFFEDELNIGIDIFNTNIDWSYDSGTRAGFDSPYGSGWYEKPGYEIEDVSCETDVSYYDYVDQISLDEFMELNPNLTREQLNDIIIEAKKDAVSRWEDYVQENAEYSD